jgi:hypothetical protein
VDGEGLSRTDCRPYDLRHAALSLWLNTGGDPAQIAARAGNSAAVLAAYAAANTGTFLSATERTVLHASNGPDLRDSFSAGGHLLLRPGSRPGAGCCGR